MKKASLIPAAGAVDALKHALDVLAECHRISEEHWTKRFEIRARLHCDLTRLRNDREIVLGYLERTFDERRHSFARLFDLADSAISRGDNQQLARALDAIVELARSSPLAAALETIESTRAALADRTRTWEV